MADLRRSLQTLAERGTAVGADETIERLEAMLADDPLVVVGGKAAGTLSTGSGTQTRRTTALTRKGLIWAAAAFIAIVSVAGLTIISIEFEDEVRDQAPRTTPDRIDTSEMSGPEIVEAGIEAWEEGNRGVVTQLFAFGFLARWSIDELAGELEYQELMPDEVSVECAASGSEVVCQVENATPMTRAVGAGQTSESVRFKVDNETIVPLDDGYPLRTWSAGHVSMAAYLRLHGRLIYAEPFDQRLKQYTFDCMEVPRSQYCAPVELGDLDEWAAWYPGDPEELIETQVEAWFGGDCETALLLLVEYWPLQQEDCPHPTIAYEQAIGAEVDVGPCESADAPEGVVLDCEIRYSNIMSQAVGEQPVAITKRFEVNEWVTPLDEVYPTDQALTASFRTYVDQLGIARDFGDACPDGVLQPSCAGFISTHLDSWAAWYANNP